LSQEGILSQSWLNAEVVVPGLPQPHLATQEVLAVALKQRFALVTHLDATLLRKLCGSGQNILAQDFLVFYGIYCFEMLKSQTTNI